MVGNQCEIRWLFCNEDLWSDATQHGPTRMKAEKSNSVNAKC